LWGPLPVSRWKRSLRRGPLPVSRLNSSGRRKKSLVGWKISPVRVQRSPATREEFQHIRPKLPAGLRPPPGSFPLFRMTGGESSEAHPSVPVDLPDLDPAEFDMRAAARD